MAKRIFDFLTSFLAIFLLLPFFVLIALIIKVDSKGDIFFIQTRVGKNLKPFKIYKFRTMKSDDASYGEVKENQNIYEARKDYKTTVNNDPRITRVGNVLRKFHLDELPQFYNVLIGDMSIVGPRPDVPAQKADYTSSQWIRRHKVKPGVSGLSQIYSSHKKYSHNLRIALDIKYTKRNNLIMDINIILQTALSVFYGKGL